MRPAGNRRISLALAGGNALGAYAAGAYEALDAAGLRPHIVAGASIGAVNAAIIAGNPPEQRVEKLREFWRQAGTGSAFGAAPEGGRSRDIYNKMHVMQTVMTGRPGMFRPLATGMLSLLPWMPPAVGLFNPTPLIATLERLVDFDLLNEAALPLVISSCDLESGEAVYFDSRVERIEPKHLLASTAFVPGFPPVEIDGRCLADPGLFCNLPLDPLLGSPPPGDQLCFAVDLFDARGQRPFSNDTALERAQDIVFSSQSLRTLEAHRREHRLRRMLGRVADRLGSEGEDQAQWAELVEEGCNGELAVVLIAYHPRAQELGAKMIEFSRASIEERWTVGRDDMTAAIATLEAGSPTAKDLGYAFYDGRLRA